MNVIEVQKISKSFGSFQAVDKVSFSLHGGSVFGLLGPNGAGKTTTIRMIMNIIVPDSGTVTVMGDNNPMTATNAIGYLPEERGLYRKMKVRELLLFLTSLKSMNRSDAKSEVDSWLEKLNLSDWKNKKVEELSKGMQQKLQIIGTILHKPKLLILDEPFMGLDPINTNTVKDIIVDLKNNGTTIIFSTHLMESAEKLCEEIFLINHGRNILSGTLSEIKSGYGKKNVLIEYAGGNGFLTESGEIESYDDYGNYVEIKMKKEGDSQKLLKLAAEKVEIRKFEIMEPSLNEIFIEEVNKTNTGEDNE